MSAEEQIKHETSTRSLESNSQAHKSGSTVFRFKQSMTSHQTIKNSRSLFKHRRYQKAPKPRIEVNINSSEEKESRNFNSAKKLKMSTKQIISQEIELRGTTKLANHEHSFEVNSKGSQTEIKQLFVDSVQYSSPHFTKKQSLIKTDDANKAPESIRSYNSRVLGNFLRMAKNGYRQVSPP